MFLTTRPLFFSFFLLLPSPIVHHDSLRYPLGECLPVALEHEALLVARVADVAQLKIDPDGLCIAQNVQSTLAHRTIEAPTRLMLLVFGNQRVTHTVGQPFALLAARRVIEEDVRLLALATAVDVHKNGTLVGRLVLLGQLVNLLRTLTEAGHLVEGDSLAHTSLPLAVLQDGTATDAVLLVLNDEVHLGTTHQQFATEAEDNVVGILIFVQLVSLLGADGSWVGSTVTAHQIERSSGQLTRRDGVGGQRLAEKGLLAGGGFLLLLSRDGEAQEDEREE